MKALLFEDVMKLSETERAAWRKQLYGGDHFDKMVNDKEPSVLDADAIGKAFAEKTGKASDYGTGVVATMKHSPETYQRYRKESFRPVNS